MPLIKINARAAKIALDGACLLRAQAALKPGEPIVILIHGYKFSPFHARAKNSPHDHILSLAPKAKGRRAISWPRHLGFGRGKTDEGLCIAFGWHAQGALWQARREAAFAARALAGLIDRLGARNPIHIMAHSLGARVALKALPALTSGKVARIILMAPAAFQSEAHAALKAPQARRVEILNVASRENDLFDAAFEALIKPQDRSDRALGSGLGHRDQRWLDIQIDNPQTLDRLAAMGFRIAPPGRRICHWSSYLRPGLFAFYAAFLRQPERLPLATLAMHLPRHHAARWSRLIARPRLGLSLLFAKKQSF
ncbi:MAG: alpha/beta fold hydrolase [Paracoccaceae bacterium]